MIRRTIDPNDRRGLKIVLSEEGLAPADEMVVSLAETEERMLSALTDAKRTQIRTLLNKIWELP